MGKEKGGIEEIWAHPFMSLRDYEVGIQFSYLDTVYWLDDERPEIEVRPESFTRIYKFRRAYLTEIITPSITDPVGVVHYEYRGVFPAKLIIKFKSNFRYMWPYSENALGSIYHSWSDELNSIVLTNDNREFACLVGANRKPFQHITGHFTDFTKVDSLFDGTATDEFFAGSLLQYSLEMNDNIDIVIAASSDGLNQTAKVFANAMSHPENIFNETKKYYKDFLKNHLMITTPDKDFNEGYSWALIGTDRFFVNTPDIGKALVAGYSTTARGWDGGHKVNGRPGYGWYFGRDAEWSGFATLDYGNFEKVKSQLEFFNKYQDLSGKIFHELTTSGAVHYDAADSTPLYIILAGKYLRHSGDIDFIKQTWKNIKKAIDYCLSTDTDGDHLMENTNVGHGWVESGKLYGSHTTLYLTSCWAEALDEASQMAYVIEQKEDADFYNSESQFLKAIINKDFWNEQDNFFYYGKLKDGSYNPEPTVLPAIPLYFKQADENKALPVLKNYSENGFTSDWGVRILSEESPLFNPRGYHYGSVWPLFTGWTSLAEYSYGRDLQGFSHILNNLLVYKNWSLGFVEEVLNGAEYKPSGVCPHQCWSETMVLQPIIEGMLGLQTDAINNKLKLSPRLPADWDFINVERIRLGDCSINFKMNRIKGKTIYTFEQTNSQPTTIEFAPYLPAGTKIKKILIDGSETLQQSNNEAINLIFTLNKSLQIEIIHTGGISVLPFVPSPKPEYRSEGFRILNDTLNENVYSIDIQGKSGNSYVMKLFLSDSEIRSISNAEIISHYGLMYEIKVPFDISDEKYLNKTVQIVINN
ncbi:MAG: hypothetical protein A2V66_10540 [Ignavibacteria bacterium RBG_13_36_8]|nr:MAG: hypothetical protein A2V66_10540 [Ignavibacteria bacterium RBG_13_36_8]